MIGGLEKRLFAVHTLLIARTQRGRPSESWPWTCPLSESRRLERGSTPRSSIHPSSSTSVSQRSSGVRSWSRSRRSTRSGASRVEARGWSPRSWTPSAPGSARRRATSARGWHTPPAREARVCTSLLLPALRRARSSECGRSAPRSRSPTGPRPPPARYTEAAADQRVLVKDGLAPAIAEGAGTIGVELERGRPARHGDRANRRRRIDLRGGAVAEVSGSTDPSHRSLCERSARHGPEL